MDHFLICRKESICMSTNYRPVNTSCVSSHTWSFKHQENWHSSAHAIGFEMIKNFHTMLDHSKLTSLTWYKCVQRDLNSVQNDHAGWFLKQSWSPGRITATLLIAMERRKEVTKNTYRGPFRSWSKKGPKKKKLKWSRSWYLAED